MGKSEMPQTAAYKEPTAEQLEWKTKPGHSSAEQTALIDALYAEAFKWKRNNESIVANIEYALACRLYDGIVDDKTKLLLKQHDGPALVRIVGYLNRIGNV